MKVINQTESETVGVVEGLAGNVLSLEILIPEWAIAVAQDSDGGVWAYSELPVVEEGSCWELGSGRGRCIRLWTGQPNPNWGNTLIRLSGPAPSEADLRLATGKDIVEGAEVFILGDDEEFHRMEIFRVLKPNDEFKAFEADDGCRYGLGSCYVRRH